VCCFARAEGWEASVITTSLFCSDDGTELQTDLRERIEATVLPIRRPHFLKRAVEARRVIDEAVGRADVVHLHTLWHDSTVESSLGQCLNMLLDASADGNGMGQRGQSFAKKYLTWPRVADMLAMYHQMLFE
jgi:hypothetical protein